MTFWTILANRGGYYGKHQFDDVAQVIAIQKGRVPMSATGNLRGHPIYFDDVWRYVDNNEPTVGAERSCGICLKATGPSGYDPCIGEVPGAVNACCGHGEDEEAYVQYPDGVRLDGIDAIRVFRPCQCPEVSPNECPCPDCRANQRWANASQ